VTCAADRFRLLSIPSAAVQVGLCGELASDPLAVSLLIGLGVEELLVSAVPRIKDLVRFQSHQQSPGPGRSGLNFGSAAALRAMT